MKTLIAIAASAAVNLALLGALDFDVLQAQTAPAGEVFVTQLPIAGELAALADAVQGTRSRAVL